MGDLTTQLSKFLADLASGNLGATVTFGSVQAFNPGNPEYGELKWVSNFLNVGTVTNAGTARTVRLISASTSAIIAPSGVDAWVFASGGATKVANVPTVALGVPAIVAATNLTAQNAALASTINYTPPASVGVYRVRFLYRPTATGASTSVGITLAFKDSTGPVSLTTIPVMTTNSTALVLPPFANTGATFAIGQWDFQIDNSATAITLSTTGTFTGTTYNFAATLEQLQ